MRWLLSSCVFALIHFLLQPCVSYGQVQQCVRDLDDFIYHGWAANKALFHAEDYTDLPADLQGTLDEAQGILYFEGHGEADHTLFSNYTTQFKDPVFLYLRYYGRYDSNEHNNFIYVFPTTDDSTLTFLDNTPDSKWGEVLIKMTQEWPIEIGAIVLYYGDYFLVDTIAILEDDYDYDLEIIRTLCPPKSAISFSPPPSTSTDSQFTSTTSNDLSTENPVIPFECSEPGFFSGNDCNTFHVCLYESSGLFGNLMFHCPGDQIWCKRNWRCEIPSLCECGP